MHICQCCMPFCEMAHSDTYTCVSFLLTLHERIGQQMNIVTTVLQLVKFKVEIACSWLIDEKNKHFLLNVHSCNCAAFTRVFWRVVLEAEKEQLSDIFFYEAQSCDFEPVAEACLYYKAKQNKSCTSFYFCFIAFTLVNEMPVDLSAEASWMASINMTI